MNLYKEILYQENAFENAIHNKMTINVMTKFPSWEMLIILQQRNGRMDVVYLLIMTLCQKADTNGFI